MKSNKSRYLLDLNALISLVEPESIHYLAILEWFDSGGKDDWGLCPLTEAGFVRVTTNPAYRGAARSLAQATSILAELATHPGYRYWPIVHSWAALTAPFSAQLFGHQQVTDAYLLGLAVRENGVLVTFDKGIKYLAGSAFSRNLLVLE